MDKPTNKQALSVSLPHNKYLLPPPSRYADADVICEDEVSKTLLYHHKLIMKLCIDDNSEQWIQPNREEARKLINTYLSDPNFIDNGHSLLIAACTRANPLFVRTLLECNANPNLHVNSKSPLEAVITSQSSSLQGQVQCIAHLIESGANPCHTTKSGFTYLHVAAENKPALLIPLLHIELLASLINEQTTKNKETPLTTLIQRGWNKCLNNELFEKTLITLLEHKADPAIEDSSNFSSYYYADHHINPEIAKWLAKYKKQ